MNHNDWLLQLLDFFYWCVSSLRWQAIREHHTWLSEMLEWNWPSAFCAIDPTRVSCEFLKK